jgi:hypothetical protein
MASNTAPPAQAVIVRHRNGEQNRLPAATFGLLAFVDSGAWTTTRTPG